MRSRAPQSYLNTIKVMSEKKELKDGANFKMMPFECSSNGMHGQYQWAKLKARVDKIHAQLMAEVQEWRNQGAQQTALMKSHRDSAVNSCVHYLRQQEERIKHEAPDGTSVGVDETNACVWTATIFGPAETLWDGGMFQVELIFPPDFPDAPPYVHFLTGIYHPHISPLGVPYLRNLIMWNTLEPRDKSVSALLQALINVLALDPSPEPATHLNVEAATLAFSRSDDDRKEYKRQVKKRVQRSMDG